MTDKTLAGTSPEDRAGLLRFWAAKPGVCAVQIGPYAMCPHAATWFVWCENAHSGVTTTNGVFKPGIIGTRVCLDHLRILHTEPRGIKSVEPIGEQLPVNIIDLDGVL